MSSARPSRASSALRPWRRPAVSTRRPLVPHRNPRRRSASAGSCEGREAGVLRRRGAATAGVQSSPWTGGRWTWLRTPDRRLLVLSILLQLVLAVLAYDATHDMR